MAGDAPSAPFIRGLERWLDLSPEERAYLQNLSRACIDVPARRRIVSEGRRQDEAYIVKTGWLAEVKLLRDGRRQILNFRLPGEIAGIDSLAYAIAPHSTVTLTDCTMAPLSVEAFDGLQRTFPRIGSALFLTTLREEANLHQWEVNLGRRSALARTAHLLLELYERAAMRGLAQGRACPCPLTQQDLADSLGLTVPYINRLLQQLRARKLVRFEEKRLEIIDPAEVAEIGGFSTTYLKDWRDRGPAAAE